MTAIGGVIRQFNRGPWARLGVLAALLAAAGCSSEDNSGGNPAGAGAAAGSAGTAGGGGGAGGMGGASGGGASAAPSAGGMKGIDISFGGTGGGGEQEPPPNEGSGGREVTEQCASTKATATDVVTVRPADIIFAIDSSGSMDEEIEFVQTYMNGFSQQIVASGVDARVIVIGERGAICIGAPLGSGQCPNDSRPPAYVHVTSPVDSHDALNVIIESYPTWRQHLRPEATKSIVVVTDDDAVDDEDEDTPNNSAAEFQANLAALDPVMFASWTLNGVFCFTNCAQAAAVGQVYKDLVAATMGVAGDLCLQDFKPVFDKLAEKIVTTSGTEIECEWPFPAAPAGQAFSGDLVEVHRTAAAVTSDLEQVSSAAACGPGGWHFDSQLNPTKIIACANTCTEIQAQEGGQIDVVFGCESVGSCVASGSSTIDNATESCEWPLPAPPAGQTLQIESVNVRYTSATGFATELGNVRGEAACADVDHGWYYDNATNPAAVIACPQTCTEVQAGGEESKIDVLFGCATVPAPPR
ncbi:MAG TPA: VWA domain-containing protein [Polyangiaceae bacterium]|nr:VWA domain-containing protein [Polyangiaceae bacterium]